MTRLVLEGDGVEELLERVRTEHGPTARVLGAERVRVGGVGGFFARQRFEVTVEVDDVSAAAGPAPASSREAAPDTPGIPSVKGSDTPLQVSRVHADGVANAGADVTGTDGSSNGKDEEHVVNAGDQHIGGRTGRAQEDLLGDMFSSPLARSLGRAEGMEASPLLPRARASAEGASGFAALLAAADAGDDTAQQAAPVAPVPVTPLAATVAAAAEELVSSTPAASGPTGRMLSTQSAAFAAVLEAVRAAAEPSAPVPAMADASSAGPVASAEGPRRARRAQQAEAQQAHAEGSRAAGPSSGQPSTPASPQGRRPQQPPADPRPSDRGGRATWSSTTASAGGSDPVHTALQRAGVPAPLLAALPSPAAPGDVLDVLSTLPEPEPLPAEAGDLVVVVGPPHDALLVAQTLAEDLRTDPEHLIVAGRADGRTSDAGRRADRVRDAVGARRAAAMIRLGDVPGVVVVQAETDAEDAAWARSLLAAMKADQVHVVVDATRKTGDVHRWLEEAFPVEPDAVHVVRATGSADPGTVLSLDLPVASLDGAPAGPGAWMSLLLPAERRVPVGASRPAPRDDARPPRSRREARALRQQSGEGSAQQTWPSDSSATSPNGYANGHVNGHGNGHVNGHGNGHLNGHVNGYGHAGGYGGQNGRQRP